MTTSKFKHFFIHTSGLSATTLLLWRIPYSLICGWLDIALHLFIPAIHCYHVLRRYPAPRRSFANASPQSSSCCLITVSSPKSHRPLLCCLSSSATLTVEALKSNSSRAMFSSTSSTSHPDIHLTGLTLLLLHRKFYLAVYEHAGVTTHRWCSCFTTLSRPPNWSTLLSDTSASRTTFRRLAAFFSPIPCSTSVSGWSVSRSLPAWNQKEMVA